MTNPDSRMPIFQFQVDGDSHGIRIDSFLMRCLRNFTRFRLQRIICAGGVAIDDVSAIASRRVRRGELVSVQLFEPPDKLFDPESININVLFEDDWLIAVDKPAGLIVHPVGKRQTGTLCNALQHRLDQQTKLPGILRPGIVHRLDRLTSGVIVVAKTFRAHKLLSIQFQERRVVKQYVALVEGHLPQDVGTIDLPIGRHPAGESILMTTDPGARDSRHALTEYRVIERRNKTTLVEVTPHTGRIHQIRVHFAALGHPLVGDEFYGPYGEIRVDRLQATQTDRGNTRHWLHASRLELAHPDDGRPIFFEAPLPVEFDNSDSPNK